MNWKKKNNKDCKLSQLKRNSSILQIVLKHTVKDWNLIRFLKEYHSKEYNIQTILYLGYAKNQSYLYQK